MTGSDAGKGPGATPLERQLMAEIAADGPLRLDAYMARALMDADHGYYQTRDPFGAKGDFITAPEVSQMFGELVGLWLANQWEAMGRPDPVHLIELGPGRGTLMADALRAMRTVPGLLEAAAVHLVEASDHLRKVQERTLARSHRTISWHHDLARVPDGPSLVIANEFLDALPVRQMVFVDGHWAERVVTIADGRLALSLQPCAEAEGLMPPSLRSGEEGQVIELCPAADAVIDQLAARLGTHTGAALLIDYGYGRPAPGDSVQAVRNHQYVDILHRPGQCDLTAHVNFQQLARRALLRGCRPTALAEQGAFLEALGLNVRARMLQQSAPRPQAEAIPAAVRRLTAPDMMGSLFKVIALMAPGLDLPPGFDGWWPELSTDAADLQEGPDHE